MKALCKQPRPLESCCGKLTGAKGTREGKAMAQLPSAVGPAQFPQSRQVSRSWQPPVDLASAVAAGVALGCLPPSKFPWRCATCPWRLRRLKPRKA